MEYLIAYVGSFLVLPVIAITLAVAIYIVQNITIGRFISLVMVAIIGVIFADSAEIINIHIYRTGPALMYVFWAFAAAGLVNMIVIAIKARMSTKEEKKENLGVRPCI